MPMKIRMKLNTKVIIAYIIISTVLFTLGGIVLFNYLRREVDEKVDWKLYAEKEQIIEASNDTLSRHEKRTMYQTINRIADQYDAIEKIDGSVVPQEELKDTLLPTFLFGGTVMRPYRQLKFYTSVDDQVYRITLRRILVEKIDLREGIVNSLLYVFIALLFILIVANYIISKRSWSPFYKIVSDISHYDFTGTTPLTLPETNIKEFNVLNRAITGMSEKIRNDFINLKEFAENASHEIQTPLAVIISKLDLLIQSKKLTAEQSEMFHSMYQAAEKLSKLNQSLILITKIENAQFVKKERIVLEPEISQIIDNFEDLIEAKSLQTNIDLDPEVVVEMNRSLVDVLFSNLITNAIRHNLDGGKINISMTKKEFTISNSGESLSCEPQHLFERFQKANGSSDSLGLGLSIVKSICDFYHMGVTYIYNEGLHELTIKFETTESL